MMWPFKQREVGTCVECRWCVPSSLMGRFNCSHPKVVIVFHPIDGSPAACEVARAIGYSTGPCGGGRLFDRASGKGDK